MKSITEYKTLKSPLISKFPSLSTDVNRINICLLGILTLFKIMNPLSFEWYPILGPKSPASIPGSSEWSSLDRIYTKNAFTPYLFSPTINYAKTIACVELSPRSPGHIFVAEMVGVWITNSSVSVSSVAVVSRPATLDPCPISVCA